MAKKTKNKNRIPAKLQIWIDARKRFKLSHVQIQMARELGMNPKKFGSLANHKQESWKAPLPVFIEECYYKRFGKEKPDTIKSIEQVANDMSKRKEEKKKSKVTKKEAESE